MNQLSAPKKRLSAMVLMMAAVVAWTGDASACVTKAVKDCPATVGHKAKGVDKHVKKVGKLAPAGNVGRVTHATGIDQLGLPAINLASVPAAPAAAPADAFGSNPMGWFYLSPTATTASGSQARPVPFSALSRAHGLLNADGSLTQYAVDKGWVRLQAPAPSIVGAPTAMQVVAPGLAPPVAPRQVQSVTTTTPLPPPVVQPAVPSLRQAAPPGNAPRPGDAAPEQSRIAATTAPALVPVPNLAGHAASGTRRAHTDHHVEVYHPVRAGVYRYQDAFGTGDSGFHLVVVGIREPDAR